MGLIFVCGDTGTGKSTWVRKKLLDLSYSDRDAKFFLIVPEQATLVAQKEMTDESRNHGIMNVDVISLARLAFRMFQKSGKADLDVLDDTQKCMIIKKAAIENRSRLKVLSRGVSRQGYVDRIKSLISELLMYGITPEDLSSLCGKLADGGMGSNKLLSDKLSDIGLIYKEFENFLKDRMLTPEGLLSEAVSAVESVDDNFAIKEIFDDAVIGMDGFTGFTPSQDRMLGFILKKAKDVYVTVTMDFFSLQNKPYQHDLFYLGYKMKKHLSKLASDSGTELKNTVFLEKDYRHEKKGRAYVNFFPTAEDEIRNVVMGIQSRIMKQGYRYRDIAVVTGSMDDYGPKLEMEMNRAGIPCFLDKKPGIMENPLVDFILAAIEVVTSDYAYDAVFRYMKNYYAQFGNPMYSRKETDSFENYVLAFGIRHHGMYEKKIYKKSKKLGLNDIEDIEKTREKFFDEFEPLHAAFSKDAENDGRIREILIRYGLINGEQCEAAGTDIMLTVLVDFMRAHRCSEYLPDDDSKAVYVSILELFDRMHTLLKGEKLTNDEFCDVLKAGLKNLKIGMVPMSNDRVMICDLTRSRFDNIKVLFVTGANEGRLVILPEAGGILSDRDREIIAGNGMELAPDARQTSFMTDYYLHIALSKPADELIVSYATFDASGGEITAAPQLGRLNRLLPEGLVQAGSCSSEDEITQKLSSDLGYQYFTQRLNRIVHDGSTDTDADMLFVAIYRKLLKKDIRYPLDINNIAEACFRENRPEKLSDEVLKKRHNERMSISRLELFAACPFSEFLNYDMNLEERAIYEIGMPDIGSFFHKALEIFGHELLDNKISWHECTGEIVEKMAEKASQLAVEGMQTDVLESSQRNIFLKKKLERVLRRTINTMLLQVKAGNFEPASFENNFDMPVADGKIILTGKIDRIDISRDSGDIGTLYRIIDYKSSSKKIDMNDCMAGLSLQLGTYSLACSSSDTFFSGRMKGTGAASVLYYAMDDPLVPEDVYRKNQDAVNQMLIMHGITLKNEKILYSTDKKLVTCNNDLSFTYNPGSVSDVISASVKKTGDMKASEELLSAQEMDGFLKATRANVDKLSLDCHNGNVSILPVAKKNETACRYCKYKMVCGFERGIEGFLYRNPYKDQPYKD